MSRTVELLRRIDLGVRGAISVLCCTLLVLMVCFIFYTVTMRYLFNDPPFWGDTASVFCNIWLVLLAYALTVRDRSDIAMQGLYAKISLRAAAALDLLWTLMMVGFGLLLLLAGGHAALTISSEYWELNGLPKRYPMMILPVAGALVTLAALVNLVEDVLRLAGKQVVTVPAPASQGELV